MKVTSRQRFDTQCIPVCSNSIHSSGGLSHCWCKSNSRSWGGCNRRCGGGRGAGDHISAVEEAVTDVQVAEGAVPTICYQPIALQQQQSSSLAPPSPGAFKCPETCK